MSVFNPDDYAHLIGTLWTKKGRDYRMVGILYGADDWYWVMRELSPWGRTECLSCVGDISMFGYDLINESADEATNE